MTGAVKAARELDRMALLADSKGDEALTDNELELTAHIIEVNTGMTTFQELVRVELEKARAKFGAQRVPHESLGVIREEYLEFECEVFAQTQDKVRMLAELVQIAAMCQRAAEDLSLLPTEAETPA